MEINKNSSAPIKNVMYLEKQTKLINKAENSMNTKINSI